MLTRDRHWGVARLPVGKAGTCAAYKGFTLTELLVVVALVALLAGLGSGTYVGTYKSLLVRQAARDFVLMAQYGRIMAIERQQQYELLIDTQGNGFLLTTLQSNTMSGAAEQGVVSDYYCRPVKLQGDVTFEQIMITPTGPPMGPAEQQQKIVFRPNGSSESAVVQIGDGKTHFTVAILAATGKARLYEGKADQVRTSTIDLDAGQ